MNLIPKQAGFTPAEIEFLSENEMIYIIPTERIDQIHLVTVCLFFLCSISKVVIFSFYNMSNNGREPLDLLNLL